MAGDSRTLKLSILADVDQLRRGLNTATTEVEGFGGKLGKWSKIAGAAFATAGAAAAAYAGKLFVDGVKAAMEDQAAQEKLATTLQNVTGATDAQIASVEDYITKTSLATGVTDEQLRPSLDRLVRSTQDVTEAQQLQALALDISTGTGKDLAAVSEALAKAHDGNFTALKRLGVPLDDNIIKSKNFDAAQKALADTFQGQAATAADTFGGKLRRLKVGFDEAKETVGSYVLDGLGPLFDFGTNNILPVLSDVSESLGKSLGPAFSDIAKIIKENVLPVISGWWKFLAEVVWPGIANTLKPILEALVDVFKGIAQKIRDNSDELAPLMDLFKTVAKFVAEKLAPTVGKVLGGALTIVGDILIGVIGGFANLVDLITRAVQKIKDFASAVANSPLGQAVGAVVDAVIPGRATGGPVTGGSPYMVGERGPELFVPNTSGSIIPNHQLGSGTVINVTVNGALDPEGVARQIHQILQQSAARTGVYTLGVGPYQLASA